MKTVQNIPVAKYHGLGNDFILLREQVADSIADLTDFVIKVCDRHTGIGADGLIVAKQNPFFMEYYNQDGSRAPMCGNGIRALTCFLYDEGLLEDSLVRIDTLAGLKTVEILSYDPFTVRVNMGGPIDDPAAIHVPAQKPVRAYELTDPNGKTLAKIDSFFMSTVHTVVFPDFDAMGKIEQAGRTICEHPFFEEQTNVNFVNCIDPSHIEVQTYERGCGVTLACGTGACASALAAYRRGLCESNVEVRLKRGSLRIEIEPDETVYMSGPAKKILSGVFMY